MSKGRFDGIGAELKARKKKSKGTAVQPSDRGDVATSQRVDVAPSDRESKRTPGKRKSGRVQIAGLIPSETRDGVRVALAFEKFDLSDLLTDLLNEWLESRPEHIRQAIQTKIRG